MRDSLRSIYEDLYFPDDAIVMAKNCGDFESRVENINKNAEAVALLLDSRRDLVKRVYYPSIGPSKKLYDIFKRRDKGYGCLVSIEFEDAKAATAFFDALPVAKGPSLGTNFTLACPYTLLAHYSELEFAAEYGVVEHLVRISVGLENDVVDRVKIGLEAAEMAVKGGP